MTAIVAQWTASSTGQFIQIPESPAFPGLFSPLASFLHEKARAAMGNIQKRHILIVEDDERMLSSLAKVLEGEGAITARASWAGEAMSQLSDSRNQFDLIITDLHMPFVRASTILGMIMERLQEQVCRSAAHANGNAAAPNHSTVPVIVLTAFGSPNVTEDCYRQGAVAVLEKPVDSARLIAAIEDALALPKTAPARPAEI